MFYGAPSENGMYKVYKYPVSGYKFIFVVDKNTADFGLAETVENGTTVKLEGIDLESKTLAADAKISVLQRIKGDLEIEETEELNVAFEKTYTIEKISGEELEFASDEKADYNFDKLNDGSRGTAESDYTSVALKGKGQIYDITFDLGELCSDIEFFCFRTVADTYTDKIGTAQDRCFGYQTVEIKYGIYKDVFEDAEIYGYTRVQTEEKGNYDLTYKLTEAISARYVKITIYSPRAVLALDEIQIFGTPTGEFKDANLGIDFDMSEMLLIGVPVNITKAKLMSELIRMGRDVTRIRGASGTLADEDIIYTGCRATVDEETFYVVVHGDISPDGKIDSTDYIMLKRHFLNTVSLTQPSTKAADIDNNGTVNSTDLIMLRRHLLRTYDAYSPFIPEE